MTPITTLTEQELIERKIERFNNGELSCLNCKHFKLQKSSFDIKCGECAHPIFEVDVLNMYRTICAEVKYDDVIYNAVDITYNPLGIKKNDVDIMMKKPKMSRNANSFPNFFLTEEIQYCLMHEKATK